jgi:hypothetical protein
MNATATRTGLYQLGGEGRALCAPCVNEVLERHATMRRSDWMDSEFIGSHPDDACDACDFVPSVEEKR